QAKAPAPRVWTSFGSNVGQTLSSVRPARPPVPGPRPLIPIPSPTSEPGPPTKNPFGTWTRTNPAWRAIRPHSGDGRLPPNHARFAVQTRLRRNPRLLLREARERRPPRGDLQ